jgi:sterol desaturase/sphingolipid hydroxylase (fatty acid hydroxylase superfamily)
MNKIFHILFGIAVPFSALLILGEMILSSFYKKQVYSRRGTLTNILLSTANFGLDLLMRTVSLFVLGYFFHFHFMHISQPWIYWICLLLLEDIAFYFLHRVDHFCRFFWAVHVTHHSSEEFNFSVGFRSSVFQPLYRFIWFIPLSLMGFETWDIMVMYSITQLYGILIHTRYIGKLGFLEWFMATPSHHRVHHGSNVPYLDRNLGMVFIVWDRLFGTFQEEQEEVVYGLTENIHTENLAKIIFHEWKNIGTDLKKPAPLKAKFMYVFGPPGWSHDGTKKTSEQLRAELNPKADCEKQSLQG